MNYPIVQNFIKFNRSYQPLSPKGMVVHATDTPGATDENEDTFYNTAYRAASAHTFIDWDSITETIPSNEVAWGSGNTSNHLFLQVELCQPSGHDTAKFQETWNRAVFYFANKFINVIKITTITKDNLMSHAEVSAKWHETDHQDPVAYFQEYGKTVDDFRAAVQQEINNQIKPEEVFEVKNLVVYGNSVDRRAAEYVADALQCPTIDGNIAYDYSKVENVVCVGGAPSNGWTSYAKKTITGTDRFDTAQKSLDFIKNGCK